MAPKPSCNDIRLESTTQTMTVNPKELTAVIFDMDGTMVDTESIYHIAWQELATDLGYTLDQTMLKATTGRRMSDCYAIIQAALGADFPMQHFQEQWWNYWTRHVQRHGIARKAGLDQLLNLLDAHAIPKAVATSSARAEALYTSPIGFPFSSRGIRSNMASLHPTSFCWLPSVWVSMPNIVWPSKIRKPVYRQQPQRA